MAVRICWKRSRVIATSASWKVIVRAWRTTRAPILISLVCRLVRDHVAISSGSSALCRNMPML